MKYFAIATLSALALVVSGAVIGSKLLNETEVSTNRNPLFETLNNQPLILNPENDGCIITSENGQQIKLKGNAGDQILIPKGTRFSGRCLSFN